MISLILDTNWLLKGLIGFIKVLLTQSYRVQNEGKEELIGNGETSCESVTPLMLGF